MSSVERSIILKGDDRGSHRPTAEGIDKLVERGLITDEAIIIQFVDEHERDLILAAIDKSPIRDDPGVGVLLHVNLVSGDPVSNPEKIPSLVDTHGRLIRPPEPTLNAWETYADTLVPEHVRREIDAQVERFFRLFGHYPHALDSHHISLYFPPGDEIGMEVALELGVPISVPKIFTGELVGGPFPEGIETNQDLFDKYRRRGIPTVDQGVVEYFNRFETLDESVERMIDVLNNLKPGITEFFFHPGHPDYATEVSNPRFVRGRVRDYETLTDSCTARAIGGIQLASYKQLFTLVP